MASAPRLHDYKGLDDAERVPGKARDEGRPRRLIRVTNEWPDGTRNDVSYSVSGDGCLCLMSWIVPPAPELLREALGAYLLHN